MCEALSSNPSTGYVPVPGTGDGGGGGGGPSIKEGEPGKTAKSEQTETNTFLATDARRVEQREQGGF
jgi:hypothetical protein